MRLLKAALALCWWALTSCAQQAVPIGADTAAATPSWQTVQRGLRYAVLSPWPHSRVHLVQLDLFEPRLRLQVSPPQARGLRMDQMATDGVVLASINAAFFGRGQVPRGLTVSDGVPWDGVFLPQTSPALACDHSQRCAIHFTPPTEPPVAWFNVVSGTPWLVRDGQARTAADDAGCESLCARTHPRTALGLDAAQRTLTLVLVEGRRGPVLGVSLAALSQWMQGLGIHNAINLDGGGSSTLWLQGQAVMARPLNEPAERALSAALHIMRVGAEAADHAAP
jgi:Phosphodiester glycosidase